MSSPRGKKRAAHARKVKMPSRPSIRGKREVLYTFNPGSLDAQFASLHSALDTQNKLRDQRMDQQDGVLDEIKKQTTTTNGRVTKLENERRYSKGYIAGAGVVISILFSGGVSLLLRLWH